MKYLKREILVEKESWWTIHYEYAESWPIQIERNIYRIRGLKPTFYDLDKAKAYVRKLRKRK